MGTAKIKYCRMRRAKQIIGIVCARLGIDPDTIRIRSRKRHLVYARQLCMFMLRKYTRLTLHQIGTLLQGDGLNHSTVIKGIRVVAGHSEWYEPVFLDVMDIEFLIRITGSVNEYELKRYKKRKLV